MNTEIQDKIVNEAAERFFSSGRQASFIEGAKFVLFTPELMREQMEDLLDWLKLTKLPDRQINQSGIAKIIDKYIEHLKQKAALSGS